jgi:hypothetical protein
MPQGKRENLYGITSRRKEKQSKHDYAVAMESISISLMR